MNQQSCGVYIPGEWDSDKKTVTQEKRVRFNDEQQNSISPKTRERLEALKYVIEVFGVILFLEAIYDMWNCGIPGCRNS